MSIKFTIQTDWDFNHKSMTLELPTSVDANWMKAAFQTVMTFLTFSQQDWLNPDDYNQVMYDDESAWLMPYPPIMNWSTGTEYSTPKKKRGRPAKNK